MKHINEDVRTAVERMRLCLQRIECNLAAGHDGRMLSDLALLSETSNRALHFLMSDEETRSHQKQD